MVHGMANATEVAVKVLDTENAENTAIVAFNLLNRTFFNSELPTPTMVITPIRDSDGNDIFSGYLRPGEHSGYPGHTIMINPLIVFKLVVQGVFDTWQIATEQESAARYDKGRAAFFSVRGRRMASLYNKSVI